MSGMSVKIDEELKKQIEEYIDAAVEAKFAEVQRGEAAERLMYELEKGKQSGISSLSHDELFEKLRAMCRA